MSGMRQYAPYPDDLGDLVQHLRYRPGWTFRLVDIERDPPDTHGWSAGGLTFVVTTLTHNAYDPALLELPADRLVPHYRVAHYFPVPAATYNRAAWQRWLFDCLVKVETHECMEFFALGGDGRLIRPFAPVHAPGADPYTVHQYATHTDRRTSFRGELNPEENQ